MYLKVFYFKRDSDPYTPKRHVRIEQPTEEK